MRDIESLISSISPTSKQTSLISQVRMSHIMIIFINIVFQFTVYCELISMQQLRIHVTRILRILFKLDFLGNRNREASYIKSGSLQFPLLSVYSLIYYEVMGTAHSCILACHVLPNMSFRSRYASLQEADCGIRL